MKWILIIAFLIRTGNAAAQLNPSRANFAAIHFNLTNERLDILSYESFLGTMLAIGDKRIGMEEIFKSMLSSGDGAMEDSLIHVWLQDFTEEKKAALIHLPVVSDDWRDRAVHLLEYAILSEATQKHTTYTKVYIELIKQKNAHFPHLPSRESTYNHPVLRKVSQYLLCTNWAADYPGEVQYFSDMLKRNVREATGSDNDAAIRRYLLNMADSLQATKNVDREYLPYQLSSVLEYYESLKAKTIKFAQLCNPGQIDEFIPAAWTLIFGDDIDPVLKQELREYIEEQELYDPEAIYFALIMARYE